MQCYKLTKATVVDVQFKELPHYYQGLLNKKIEQSLLLFMIKGKLLRNGCYHHDSKRCISCAVTFIFPFDLAFYYFRM